MAQIPIYIVGSEKEDSTFSRERSNFVTRVAIFITNRDEKAFETEGSTVVMMHYMRKLERTPRQPFARRSSSLSRQSLFRKNL